MFVVVLLLSPPPLRYPLQAAGRDVVGVIRRLRTELGPTGTLVTLTHSESGAGPRLALEADVVVRVKAVEGAGVTGRLAASRPGQERDDEVVFSVRADGVALSRPV